MIVKLTNSGYQKAASCANRMLFPGAVNIKISEMRATAVASKLNLLMLFLLIMEFSKYNKLNPNTNAPLCS